MKKNIAPKVLAASLGLLAFLTWIGRGSANVYAQYDPQIGIPEVKPAELRGTPDATIRDWPASSRDTANLMIEKYGAPELFNERSLVWLNKGGWKRTVVRPEEENYLEQTIGYPVPRLTVVFQLKRFSPRVAANQKAEEMSFASDSEEKNRLGINLAHEIIIGKRSVGDARSYFIKTLDVARAGKSSPYLESFLFEVDNKDRD